MTACCVFMDEAITKGIVEAAGHARTSWINGILVEYAYCPWCGKKLLPYVECPEEGVW